MLRAIRLLLLLAVVGLAIGTFVYHDKSQVEQTLADPRSNPKFADIVASPFQAILAETNPTTIHEGDYSVSMREFHKQHTAINDQIYDATEAKNNIASALLIAFICLLVALLPWRRWSQYARRSGETIAQQASILAIKGNDAWKARTAPSPVVGRHGLKSYSVADELLKWSKLREEGIVSEVEFEEARDELLSR